MVINSEQIKAIYSYRELQVIHSLWCIPAWIISKKRFYNSWTIRWSIGNIMIAGGYLHDQRKHVSDCSILRIKTGISLLTHSISTFMIFLKASGWPLLETECLIRLSFNVIQRSSFVLILGYSLNMVRITQLLQNDSTTAFFVCLFNTFYPALESISA